MTKQSFKSHLFDFAYFPSYDASIKFLAETLSDKEKWDFSDATDKKYTALLNILWDKF